MVAARLDSKGGAAQAHPIERFNDAFESALAMFLPDRPVSPAFKGVLI